MSKQAYTIPELEWEARTAFYYRAISVVGDYEIIETANAEGSEWYLDCDRCKLHKVLPTKDEAKAAAQAHYEEHLGQHLDAVEKI